MFTGEYDHTIDDKGRVLIPQPYREELGTVVRVGRGLHGQINIYPNALWQQMVEKLQAPGINRVALENTYRAVLGAVECEVDRQGRLLIPSSLRRWARLENDIIINGNLDRLEIWTRERFDAVLSEKSDDQTLQDDPEARRQLGLSR